MSDHKCGFSVGGYLTHWLMWFLWLLFLGAALKAHEHCPGGGVSWRLRYAPDRECVEEPR